MAKSQNKLIQALLKRTQLTVVDIETSGMMEEILSSGAAQRGVILQVGGVHTPGLGSKDIRSFEYTPHPAAQGVNITSDWLNAYKGSTAYGLHGISTPFPGFPGNLNSVKEIRQRLSALYPSSSKGLLLGYNLRNFDLPFIQSRVGWSPAFQQQGQIVDVMQLAKRSMPGLKSYALADVAKALNIKTQGTALHQSVADSMLTLQVFNKLSNRGDIGLGEILKRIHGVQSIGQMKEQEYWHNKNREYWRSKEAAMTDGIKIPNYSMM